MSFRTSPLGLLLLVALASCHAGAPSTATPATSARVGGPSESSTVIDLPARPHDAAAKLGCTLMRPAGVGPSAGVILLRGTGPQDRNGDGEEEHYSLYRAMAVRLSERGVASLRCDSRGFGESTGRFWDGTFETYVADAHAMLAALHSSDGIDPKRIGIVAHSEGGVVAPVVADEASDVRTLVLVSAGARPFVDSVLWQAGDQQRRAGASKDKIEAAVEQRRSWIQALAKDGELPATFPAGPDTRADMLPMVPWLKSRIVHDTRAQNRKLRHLPVLIVQGGHDLSTPPEDANILETDLTAGHNPDAEAVVFPLLSHDLVRARVDEARPLGPIDGEALDRIAGFVARSLARGD